MTGAGAYDAVGRLHWSRSSPLPHTFLPEGEHMLPHEGKCHTQRPKDTAPVCVDWMLDVQWVCQWVAKWATSERRASPPPSARTNQSQMLATKIEKRCGKC